MFNSINKFYYITQCMFKGIKIFLLENKKKYCVLFLLLCTKFLRCVLDKVKGVPE